MAKLGTGFFDKKGHFFKNARDATASDIAALLGQIGDGESLAPGIAHLLLDRRDELEQLFAEHDAMMEDERSKKTAQLSEVPSSKVTKFAS